MEQERRIPETEYAADLILLEARGGYGSLCIEMKTGDKSSKQRPSQKAWQEASERAGNRYVVIRSFEAFRAVLTEYMGLPASGRVFVTAQEVAAGQAAMDRARENTRNERERLKWR